MIINANGDPARFADTGLPVVAEVGAGFRRSARRHPRRPRLGGGAGARVVDVVSVPGDCPFLPADLVAGSGGARAAGRRSPAPAPANGGIRWLGYGRWHCATICARR